MNKPRYLAVSILLVLSLICCACTADTSRTDRTGPVLSEISFSILSNTSLAISWTTDEEASSLVRYGTSTAYGSSILGAGWTKQHHLVLTGLQPCTIYHLKIVCTDPAGNETASGDQIVSTAGDLQVLFLDVGQGDAILVDYGTFEVLIDGGGRSPGVTESITAYVDEAIDLLVATHNHADHMGGLIEVFEVFEVEEVWHNGDDATTVTYADFVAGTESEDAKVVIAMRGLQLSVGDMELTVLSPADIGSSSNDNSIVIHLSYREIDFLFTGDAEHGAEESMLAAGIVPDIDVLKVGHHASRTASSYAFLAAARPEHAIYMAGVGNTYGHPHTEAIDNLNAIGAVIYGTDINGTIAVLTDGISYQIQVSKGGPL